MERYDVLSAREGSNGKSYFTKLGVAFPNKNGDGFSVLLDAVPAPVDGQFKLIVKRPQERDDRPQQRSQGGGYRGVDDGDAPF